MSKDLKLLLISLGLFFLMCIIIIVNSERECHDVRYQNLDGTHTKTVCQEK